MNSIPEIPPRFVGLVQRQMFKILSRMKGVLDSAWGPREPRNHHSAVPLLKIPKFGRVGTCAGRVLHDPDLWILNSFISFISFNSCHYTFDMCPVIERYQDINPFYRLSIPLHPIHLIPFHLFHEIDDLRGFSHNKMGGAPC